MVKRDVAKASMTDNAAGNLREDRIGGRVSIRRRYARFKQLMGRS
jgi:hypothetical protein